MELAELWEYVNLYLNGMPTYRLRRSKMGMEPEEALRLYREMILGLPEPKDVRVIHLQKWEETGPFAALIKRIKQAFGGMSGSVVLMGSLADRSSTGYSDVDMAYFPQDKEMTVSFVRMRRALRNATRTILSFDHLQHHGIFVIPAETAAHHSPLPPSAFHGAVVLQGENEITLGGWRMSWKRDLPPILEKLATLAEKPRLRPWNLYGIKLLLSQIMLLPTLFLSTVEEDVPKPDSFVKIKKIFPNDCAAIDLASQMRMEWKRPESRVFRTGIALTPSPWDFAFVARRLFRPGNELIYSLDERFYRAAGQLAKRMRDALEG
ncbi:MAG: hypothetical protein ACP5QG_07840 [candidate division WOR-3 bacterium]